MDIGISNIAIGDCSRCGTIVINEQIDTSNFYTSNGSVFKTSDSQILNVQE